MMGADELTPMELHQRNRQVSIAVHRETQLGQGVPAPKGWTVEEWKEAKEALTRRIYGYDDKD